MAQSNQSSFQFDPGAPQQYHDLKISLKPYLVSKQKKVQLHQNQLESYVSFVKKNHDKVCQKIGRLLDVQITKFSDHVLCLGRVTDLSKLENVWDLCTNQSERIDEDIRQFMEEWKCHEELSVPKESLNFSIVVDKKSYKIGLIQLTPEEEDDDEGFASTSFNAEEGTSVDPTGDKHQQAECETGIGEPGVGYKVKTESVSEQSATDTERKMDDTETESKDTKAKKKKKRKKKKKKETKTEINPTVTKPSEGTRGADNAKGTVAKLCDTFEATKTVTDAKETVTKQSGASEQRTKAKGGGAATKPPETTEKISMTIHLVIPHHVNATEAWVTVNEDNTEEQSCNLKRSDIHECVWKTNLPVLVSDCANYRCRFGITKYQLFSSIRGSKDVEEKWYKPLPLMNNFYHIFTDPSVTAHKDIQDDTYDGCGIIVEIVSKMTSNENLKDNIMILQDQHVVACLIESHSLNREKKFRVLRKLLDLLHESHDAQLLCLLHTLSSCFKKSSITLDISKAVAKRCLDVVYKSCFDIFPSKTDFMLLGSLCRHLFDRAFQKHMTTFEVVYFCFPFLTSECVVEMVKYERGKEETGLDQCLAKVASCVEQYGREAIQPFLLVVRKASSFEKILETVKTIAKSKMIQKELCQEIQDCVKKEVIAKVTKEIVDAASYQRQSLRMIAEIVQKLTTHAGKDLLLKVQIPIEDKIIEIVKFSSRYWSEDEVNMLSQNILSDLTFSKNNSRELMKILAESKCPQLHSLFVVYVQKAYTSLEAEDHHICLHWLNQGKSFLKQHRSKAFEQVLDLYVALGYILELECVAKDAALIKILEDSVYSDVCKIKVEVLMEAWENAMGLSKTSRDVFERQCKARLLLHRQNFDWERDNEKILEEVFGPGPIHLDKMATYDMFMDELLSKHPAFGVGDDDMKGISAIFQNWKFWFRIMTCKGPEAGKVTSHRTSKHLRTLLTNLYKVLENQHMCPMYAKWLFDLLKTTGEKNCVSFLNVVLENSIEHDYPHLVKRLEQSLGELDSCLESLQKANKMLQFISQNKCRIVNLSARECQLEEFICDVSNSKITIIDVLEHQDWEEVWHLSSCLELHVVSSMQSFKNHILDTFDPFVVAVHSARSELGTDESDSFGSTEFADLAIEETDIKDDKMSPEHSRDSMSERSKDKDTTDYSAPKEDKRASEARHELHEGSDDSLVVHFEVIDSTEYANANDVVDYVSKQLLPSYHEKAMALLMRKESVLVADLENFFKECDIMAEVKEVERVLHQNIPEMFSVVLGNIADFDYNTDKAEYLVKLPTVFMLDSDDTKPVLKAVKSMLEMKQNTHLLQTETLYRNSKSFLEQTKQIQTEYQWEVIAELSTSQGLIEFLISVQDEDLRNLIDAVEEHSDELLQEGIVSDFIQLKNMLHPVLRECTKNKSLSLSELMRHLNKCFSTKETQAPQRINNCAHNCNSLKALYMNVANRGEVTKHTVGRILKDGIVVFSLHNDTVTTSVKCSEGKEKVYQLSDMSDLRSRALLISNTEKVKPDEKNKTGNLVNFVEFVDLVNEIDLVLQELSRAGHFDFDVLDCEVTKPTITEKIDHLANWKEKLQGKLQEWEQALAYQRSKHYYLNFLHGKQLSIVFQYFNSQGRVNKEALGILRYMRLSAKNINCTEIEPLKDDGDVCVDMKLHYLGTQLAVMVGSLADEQNVFLKGDNSIDSRVEVGNMFIAHIDSKNPHVMPVVLSMYANTTGLFPLPAHLLFCNEQTTFEECMILLNRSHYGYHRDRSLHCIIGIEMLEYDVLFSLMKEMKMLSTSTTDFLLAFICRSDVHHPFLDSFRDKVHKIPGLSAQKLEECLQLACPLVYMVTSDLPGLGKTEKIHDIAAQAKKGIVTVPVSGLQTKKSLLKQLQMADVSKDVVLHLDIGHLDDCQVLDHLLFEVLVMKFALCETHYFELKTDHVAIEICNTLNNYLQNALYIASCFQTIHLKWTNFTDFVVSMEQYSAVQVVCQYLRLKQEDGFGKEDVSISEITAPIESNRCQMLLRKTFEGDTDLSFSIVNTFLEALADQLRKLTVSQYFKINCLCLMLGDQKKAHSVRELIVTQLIAMSKEFSCRSIAACKSSQHQSVSAVRGTKSSEVDEMVNRVKGMIQWNSSNHLLLLFHLQDSATVSALYRNVSDVPEDIRQLFQDQLKKPLPDLTTLPQDDLKNRLERLVCDKKDSNVKKRLGHLCDTYALTPDNLLKMVLIILRIKNGVPVVLMGETGCGKTTLVKYLAKTCDAKFYDLQFHAGITEDVILEKVVTCNTIAMENLDQQHWLFLDEINTCNHLGLLNEIITSHSCGGKKLSPNLVTLAACNPYRLREEHEILSCGLTEKARTDEFSQLVYRVHPLPETMIDFVWDYGTLHETDELMYIKRMVGDLEGELPKIADILMASQKFVRKTEISMSAVSLRDVYRCKTLIEWFLKFLTNKDKHIFRHKNQSLPFKFTAMSCHIRALILSLSLSYEVRMPKTTMRKDYWKTVTAEMSETVDTVTEFVRWEQMNILNRMILPHGTAKNTALRENVFVILTCMLNRIPIFLVGKPGCSKSLSVQVLKSSLRGPDSVDKFLQTLPELYIVSYQGSESSTSEGIQKVFEKANNYKRHKRTENILPVVLLDEVGLAEISKFNPLKVLHTLLEPDAGDFPDVAVVGISNWALDSAKMNRAVHLSRPDLTADELYDTGMAIRDGFQNRVPNDVLKTLAVTYFHYHDTQPMKNFHGLRDFYSLVKFLCPRYDSTSTVAHHKEISSLIMTGISRNFGGLCNDTGAFARSFERNSKRPGIKHFHGAVVKNLIEENLADSSSRHLMIITSGDSSLGLISEILRSSGRHCEIIYGSKFEEDMNEEYNYRIISKIILCMEQGVVLILKDLESVYGSLYDMLNQNYTIVGRKKNCRIALDAYSNPMCVVHDNFKCIVIVDRTKVDYSDPPFLNRFEKQILLYEEVLSSSQRTVVKTLEKWVADVSHIEGKIFTTGDAFFGFQSDSIPSLIHRVQKSKDREEDVIERCKQLLLYTCPPSAVLRMSLSRWAEKGIEDIEEMQEAYFDYHTTDGIQDFFYAEGLGGEVPKKYVIMTNTDINTDVHGLCPGILCHVEKLSAVKSEKQLSNQISKFFSEDKVLFVLQCKPSLDSEHMLLAKLLIENERQIYIQSVLPGGLVKHVAFLIHLSRSEDKKCHGWKFDYTNDWELFTLDMIEKTKFPIRSGLLGNSPHDLLKSDFCPVRDVISHNLVWALGSLEYSSLGGSAKRLWRVGDTMQRSECLLNFLCEEIMTYAEQLPVTTQVNVYHTDNWYIDVAKNPVKMLEGGSLHGALNFHLQDLVKNALVELIWFLESTASWWSYTDIDGHGTSWLKFRWEEMFQRKFSHYKSAKSKSSETERFVVTHSPVNYNLPYSRDLLEEIDDVVQLFLMRENIGGIDSLEDIIPEDRGSLIRRYIGLIEQRISDHLGQKECDRESFERLKHDFYLSVSHTINSNSEDDFYDESASVICRLFLEGHCLSLPGEQLIDDIIIMILTWALQKQKVKQLLKLLAGCGSSIRKDVMNALKTYRITQSASEEEAEDTDIDEHIVTCLCRSLMPVRTCLEKFSCFDEWYCKCSQLLAYASKVNPFSELLHFLRLCRDIFMASVFETEEHCVVFLDKISQEVLTSEDTTAEDQGIFDCDSVYQHFESSTETDGLSALSIQKILLMYFLRCLDANPNTPRRIDAITYLTRQKNLDLLVVYAGPIIQRMLYTLAKEDTLLKVLQTDEAVIDIDELQKFLEPIPVTDFHVCICLCNDVVENMMSDQLFESLDLSEGSIQRFQHAVAFIKRSETWSVKYIVCVSYARLFIESVAKFILGDPNSVNAERATLQRVDASLTWNEQDKESLNPLKVYFLKQLYMGSLKDLKERVAMFPSAGQNMTDIPWPTNTLESGIGFRGMCAEDEMAALDGTADVLGRLALDYSNIESVVAVLAERFYWPRYIEPLEHSHRIAIKEIELAPFHDHAKELLECVLGRKEFVHSILNITQESTYESLLQASFLLHTFTVFVSNSGKLLHEILRNTGSENNFLCDVARLCVKSVETEMQMISCKCNHVIFCSTSHEANCDTCKEKYIVTKHSYKATQLYKCQTPTFHIGGILFHGCMLVEANCKPEMDSEALDETFNHFKSHWNSLVAAMNVSAKQMTFFLHMLLKNTEMINATDPAKFVQCCNTILEERQSMLTEFTKGMVKKTDLLAILNECDNDNSNGYSLICRHRTMPTIEKMCCQIASSRFEVCPFLHIALMYKEELLLLNHLLPIVMWHLMLYPCINVKMSQKEAESLQIDDFIYQDVSEKDRRKKCFTQFKESWNAVRCSKVVQSRIGHSDSIPEVTRLSPVSSCIVKDENSPMYHVMSVLCAIQNVFIQKAAIATLAGCKGLSFLKKGPFVEVPTIHLQAAQDSNVIRFDLPEGVTNYCQNNLRYGEGFWENYNLAQIEKDMADDLMLGKNYLMLGEEFPFTMYRNEVFHQGGHSVTVLRNKFMQVELTENIKVTLHEGLRENFGQISLRPFITFLETVMIFMKKTGIQETDMLGTYAQRWGIEYENVKAVTLREQIQKYVKLSQVCSLYEFLEEEAAKTVFVESLDENYAVKPSMDVVKMSEDYLDKEVKDDLMLLSAVRRLIVRHISSEMATVVSPDLAIAGILFHQDLWPNYENKNSAVTMENFREKFPALLMIQNIKWFHDRLTEKVKVKAEKTDMASAPLRTVQKKKKRTRILMSKT